MSNAGGASMGAGSGSANPEYVNSRVRSRRAALFDEDEYIGVRMDRFAELYGSLDEGGGGLLSLATILLTFAYPREYIFYKWSLMSSFFGDFAAYDVDTGYETDQYWKLNLACREQILPVLDRELDDATLLDVHTLLYVYHKEYTD